jgi:hypothetical protein
VSLDGSGGPGEDMPRWVEMKCNSLIYLKQAMKYNRKKKQKLMRIEEQMEKDKEGKDNKEAPKEEAKEVSKETDEAKKEKSEEKIEPSLSVDTQINENISMMCPICHFFMYKSVCASCSHMFCQYCLDEYLIFKDSCPV